MKSLSSTSNFKLYARRILAFVLALAATYGAASITAQALSARYDDRNASQRVTSCQLADFYALPENSLDVLILGSSHAMCTFDPMRIEASLGKSAFNLGTALQQPDTAYYLLREALKTQKPEFLIYDVYFKVLQEPYGSEQAMTVLKEMPASTNALSMFWFTLDADSKVSFYNNWLNPFARIQSIVKNSNRAPEETPAYRGRGFYCSDNVVAADQLTPETHPFAQDYPGFHARQVDYLRKLITLAQENDITVILTSAPIPPTILSRISYYDKILADTQAIADEFSVPFYDFARPGASYLSDRDFADQGHLNRAGDKKFMDYFVAFAKAQGLFAR